MGSPSLRRVVQQLLIHEAREGRYEKSLRLRARPHRAMGSRLRARHGEESLAVGTVREGSIHPTPKEVAMKHVMAVLTLCSLVVPAFVLVDSDAWSRCTPEQRIELGKQGYDKSEVDQTCNDSGDDFWNALSNTLGQALTRGVEIGAANGLNKLDQALGGNRNNYSTDASSTFSGASRCETTYGTCSLSGGPVGYPCYCRAWNGTTFTGISK